MAFLSENWFFVLVLLVCLVMHFFHGLGGHGTHDSTPEREARRPGPGHAGHDDGNAVRPK